MSTIAPCVSVGLPVFNGARSLRQALDSLIGQDFADLEIVISDNGSTDATEAICLEYAARDPRIRYYRNPSNLGVKANFERVLDLARGEYFMWAAHDDYWAPEYIRLCLEAFRRSDDLVLITSAFSYVDPETDQPLGHSRVCSTIGLGPAARYREYIRSLERANKKNSLFYGLYKREQLVAIGPISNLIGGDHLLLADLSLRGEFLSIPQVLFFKRGGGASASYAGIARLLGISNPFLIAFPLLMREIFLQRIIFGSNRLGYREKIGLSLWSGSVYLRGVARKHMARARSLSRRVWGRAHRAMRIGAPWPVKK